MWAIVWIVWCSPSAEEGTSGKMSFSSVWGKTVCPLVVTSWQLSSTISHQGKLHTDFCLGRLLRWGWENQRGMRSCRKQWVCFFCQLGTGRQRQHDLVSQDLQREQDPILRIFVAPGQNVMLVQTKPIIYKFHNFLENSWRKYSFFAWTEAPLRLWFGATTSKILKV